MGALTMCLRIHSACFVGGWVGGWVGGGVRSSGLSPGAPCDCVLPLCFVAAMLTVMLYARGELGL